MGGDDSIQTLGKEKIRWSTKNPELDMKGTGSKKFILSINCPPKGKFRGLSF